MSDYIVAICAAVGALILMAAVFAMSGKTEAVALSPKKAKPQPVSQKKKKKLAAKEREEAREQKEAEEILDREIARNPGMSADSKSVRPETLKEVSSKKGSSAATQMKSAAPKAVPRNVERKEDRDDGFKPVSAVAKAPKKEKTRAPASGFEVDEEMEKKLAAFFNRSDRRSKGFSALQGQNDTENRGNYVRIKQDFSTDSKWFNNENE